MKIAYYLIIIFILAGCSRSNNNDPLPPNVTISSISPLHGPNGTVVSVSGTGFGSIGTVDSILFNGKKSEIISINDTLATAKVPKLAGTGVITLWKNGKPVTGPVFTYDTTYIVTTLAGSGNAGWGDGKGTDAGFNNPASIVVDKIGNVFVGDVLNKTIRKITPDGAVTTFVGTANTTGNSNGTGTDARIGQARGMTIDDKDNIYFTDLDALSVKKVTPQGVVTTVAGSGGYGSADGPAMSATFKEPYGITIDKSYNLYVVDLGAASIRKISAAGQVTTIAGGNGYGHTDGAASTSSFYDPNGITIDINDNLIIADQGNHLIRKLSGNIVSTVAGGAGNTSPGFEDGPSNIAKFFFPANVVTDRYGNIYVADCSNYAIRKINKDGYVKRYAGGAPGSTDGPANAATFNTPYGVAIDAAGNLYITDVYNNKIRKVTFE